ncbi:MAG: hypothetical protein E5Y73_31660 [Mesorhizobium sp.]|uniref:phage/plasmid primase, P4 family n=1 Tax=Mesorhizobium sp. TaxID=1871066 RepID=UPI00121C2C2B|nr:phage/plasmid primase, P4 family [Mesorhizobium sp.]TIL84754.1 MAG: hypothetical protein E5Y73_31660 [Mesorhizobium sp.]
MTDGRKPLTRGDVDREIERLSHLDVVDFELVREAKAEEFGLRVGVLEKLVKRKQTERRSAGGGEAEDDQDDDHEATRPPAFTDEALALKFAFEHRYNIRYVALWGKWLWYDGRRWAFDDTLNVFDRARETCRRAAADCNDERLGKILASAKTVAAVERLSKSDRRIAATVDQWDADPWLLNTPGGVVDLRTGVVRKHSADDYMTKITAVTPDNAMPFPRFEAFLGRITGGDVEAQKFLNRLAGYALTGVTTEHAMAFFYGTGANGKSVILDTLASILADYHATAPFETFAASKNERHPTDVAGLQGARLVTTAETAEGRHWDETKLKQLTGGDRVKARFMRQDFFEFTPQFKLFVAGNHKPSLRTVDEAIRRRLHLVPFSVTIPAAERDPQLKDKLRPEWPAILDWMVEGCLDWQEKGLNPPAAVVAASEAYLAEEDTFGRWLLERCDLDANAWTSSAELFRDFDQYARAGNEHAGTSKEFGSKLETQVGIVAQRVHAGRGYRGLKLKTENAQTRPNIALERLPAQLARVRTMEKIQ